MIPPIITEKYGATCQRKRRGYAPKYIVVHYTGVANTSAEATARGFSRKNAKTSAHYVVDDREIHMCADESVATWHVGDGKPDTRYAGCRHAEQWHATIDPEGKFRGNRNSIGVELCVRKVNAGSRSVYDLDWEIPENELELAAHLIAWICLRRGIPTQNVIRHYDATGKPCPRPLVTMQGDPDDSRDKSWRAFKRRIQELINADA